MHDEVSETENIRKNLAIERMIVEGCEVLLDTSQTFVRQGESVVTVSESSVLLALCLGHGTFSSVLFHSVNIHV